MAARSRSKEPTQAQIGSCFAAPVGDGRYAVCQVIGQSSDSEQVEVIALDWLGESPPTLAELADAKLLIIDHHNWDATPERCMVSVEPPPEFVALGVREPLARFDEPCRSYGFWEGVVGQVSNQRWWAEEAPRHEVAAYKLAKQHANERVALVLGGETHAVQRGSSTLRIGPSAAIPVAADVLVDWSALDVFGRLDAIEYEGGDSGVLEYVTRRVLIDRLDWRGHGQTRIDLAHARLELLTIEVGEGPLELALSAEIEALTLLGYRGQALTIVHPSAGRGLSLSLFDLRDAVPPAIAGLERLTRLTLGKPRVVDLAGLGYPSLESLRIYCDAGRLEHIDALAQLRELRELRLNDVYDMDPEQFPTSVELPQLASVMFNGLRTTHAKLLKVRLAKLAQLELRGAKTDAWLAANAHNPFNDWVDESPALARAACKLYKQTLARVTKLDPGDRTALHAELLAFVRAFNRIDVKHGLDTIHREHIYDVFHQLAADSQIVIEGEVLDEWFDEDREF